MANYCSNVIAIYRDDDSEKSRRQNQDLYIKLESLGTEHTVLKSTHKSEQSWYGNILTMCGEDAKDVDGRGSIEDVSWEDDGNEDGGWIRLQTETAWEPQMEIIEKLIEKYYPNLTFEYIAEECGCEIYENSDTSGRFFKDRYKLDFDFSDLEDGYSDQDYYSNDTDFKNAVEDVFKEFAEALKKRHFPKITIEDKLYHSGEEKAFSMIKQMQDYVSEHEDDLPSSYFSAHKFD